LFIAVLLKTDSAKYFDVLLFGVFTAIAFLLNAELNTLNLKLDIKK